MILEKLLLEIKKQQLLAATDRGRLNRARYQVRAKPPTVTILSDGTELIEFNVKAFPSYDGHRQYGYIQYDPKTKDIKELFCSCSDWKFRLYSPFVRSKLARWNLPDKYNKILAKLGKVSKKYGWYGTRSTYYSRKWTYKTNRNGRLFSCKHISCILMGYVD